MIETSRRAMGKAWLEKVKTSCPEVKFVAHYALLGQYDFCRTTGS